MNALTPSHVAFAVLAVLSALLIAAAASDLRRRRIPNALVIPGACIGLLLNILLPDGNGFASTLPGSVGIGKALLGMGIGLAIFLPFYIARAMGAGDVKLMAMVGAFLGPNGAIESAAFIFLTGGVLSVIFLMRNRAFRQLFLGLYARLVPVRLRSPSGSEPEKPASTGRLPFAAAVAGGAILYVVLSRNGILSQVQILPNF